MATKVIIVGGGIGGLVTALKLHQSGISVRVFESVEEVRELGVGINVLPHAIRILTNLGLSDALSKTGIPTEELIYHNKFGQPIWQEPRGLSAGYNWPQYSIHRGRLQMILLQAVRKQLGDSSVITGHHLASFSADQNGVAAMFVNRKTGSMLGTYHADVLIGADGIHSTVRRFFYPNEGPPKFSGMMMYRGVTEFNPFLSGRSMIMAGHYNQKFVAYPICPEVASNGKALVNWVAEIRVNRDTPPRTDWYRRALKEDFVPYFAKWKFDWLDIPQLISETEEVYQFPMVDRDPLPRWSFGRVTLLGDAAHPMYPIGSNGASQAILDSEALGQALTENSEIITALRKYEELRLEPTSAVVNSNRQMGPERVMQIIEERAPNGFVDLNEVISRQELENIAQGYKKLAGFEKDTLNAIE